jgi:UDP-glucose 4-epimerase
MMRSFFENKVILFTGGNGYIASNIIQLLKSVPCRIIRFDRPGIHWNDVDRNKAFEIQDRAGDIRDPEIWESLIEGVDIIYHLAAQTSMTFSNQNPLADLEVNVIPLLRLAGACRAKAVQPMVIYSGTVTEVGLTPVLPVGEAHVDRPITIYDIHKLTAENYIKHFCHEGVMKGAILRLANVYGPGPKSSQADRGILNQMIARAIRGENLTVYGDGNFMRDYVFIDDVARAFIVAAENMEKLNGQHFVIGSGKGTTIQSAFEKVADRVSVLGDTKVAVVNVAAPSDLPRIEKRNFVADISAFTKATGWEPRVSLGQGINITADWYLNN